MFRRNFHTRTVSQATRFYSYIVLLNMGKLLPAYMTLHSRWKYSQLFPQTSSMTNTMTKKYPRIKEPDSFNCHKIPLLSSASSSEFTVSKQIPLKSIIYHIPISATVYKDSTKIIRAFHVSILFTYADSQLTHSLQLKSRRRLDCWTVPRSPYMPSAQNA
jgi:hypothetical protein